MALDPSGDHFYLPASREGILLLIYCLGFRNFTLLSPLIAVILQNLVSAAKHVDFNEIVWDWRNGMEWSAGSV